MAHFAVGGSHDPARKRVAVQGFEHRSRAFEARCNWRRFDPEETLVDFDDLSTDVYFLLSGDVRVLMRTASGKEVILDEMRPNELFGELAAMDGDQAFGKRHAR